MSTNTDSAAPGGDVDNDRTEFERWVKRRHGLSVEKWADTGNYTYGDTRTWWECWVTARAALSAPKQVGTIPDGRTVQVIEIAKGGTSRTKWSIPGYENTPLPDGVYRTVRVESDWKTERDTLYAATTQTAPQPVEAEGREVGLTSKQAWWAGYRAGKGLPPDIPRQIAVAAPNHVSPYSKCDKLRPGAPCATPESCQENGCNAVERELFTPPGQPAIDLEQFQWAANRWKKEAEYHANGIADDYGAGQRHAFFSCATELLAIIDGAKDNNV